MKLTFLLPNLRLYGGIKSTIALAEAMRQRGHEVVIVSPIVPGRDGRAWLNLRRTMVQIVRTFQNLLVKPNWFDFSGQLKRIPWLSCRFLPEADFLVLSWWADVLSVRACETSKGRQIHFVRSYEIWGGPSRKVRQSYLVDLPVIVTSLALKETLAHELGVTPVGMIANGLDPVFFETPAPARAPGKPPRVGVLYRLQEWKRMDDAFAVLAGVRAQARFQPVIFGEHLRAAHRLELGRYENAEYHHLPAGGALRDVYRSLDVFLFTSDETEAFGNPPFEALAAGAAVVSTRVGAVPEFLTDNVDARLCGPRDVDCLTRSVLDLIARPELGRQLAGAGAAVVRRLDWRAAAADFEEILEDLRSQTS